ncbi:MAG: hypothetical protein EXR72_11365 [Myxococcales bacterium]|nr:hypothetical protein [Myxococcales bacterium]
MDSITLDPGADDNGLAAMLSGLLSENLAASEAKRRDFEAIRTHFGVVAPDAEVAVTLAFDRGRCTVYDGLRPEAEVVITADSEKIPSLSLLQIRYGLPWVLDEAGRQFVRALLRREIKIAGLVDFPIPRPLDSLRRALDLVRLTRVLSVG